MTTATSVSTKAHRIANIVKEFERQYKEGWRSDPSASGHTHVLVDVLIREAVGYPHDPEAYRHMGALEDEVAQLLGWNDE